MHFAAQNGRIVDIAPKDLRGLTPMHRAAKAGHVDVIKALKEAGANVMAKNGLTGKCER